MIVVYVCEICGVAHSSREAAARCEARPKPREYPVGMIFGNHGGFYSDITFAVAANNIDGHSNHIRCWACRDNGAGDSLGGECCASPGVPNTGMFSLDTNHPTFGRLVAYLRNSGIEPAVWDGVRPVPLAEYLVAEAAERSEP